MPMMLHNNHGAPFWMPCGLVEAYGVFYADNGFGEYEKVDGYPGIVFILDGKEGEF